MIIHERVPWAWQIERGTEIENIRIVLAPEEMSDILEPVTVHAGQEIIYGYSFAGEPIHSAMAYTCSLCGNPAHISGQFLGSCLHCGCCEFITLNIEK